LGRKLAVYATFADKPRKWPSDPIKRGTRITINQQPDTDQQPAQIDPKVDFPQPGSGLDLPAAQAKGPQRPTSPKDGLPHLDNVDDEQQEAFDKCFLALAERLQGQSIALSITEFAKNFLCAPYNQMNRNDLSPEQAFEALIEKPLTEELQKKEVQAGDWVQIDMYHQDVVFKKNGGAQA